MSRLNYLFFLLFAISVFFSSCQKVETKPQDPLWGKQNCSTCRMILSDKRFAVQRILPSGKVFFYDDIICALTHKHSDSEGILYVRPYGEQNWSRADQVKYTSGLMTPMNSGYGAVKSDGDFSFEDVKQELLGNK